MAISQQAKFHQKSLELFYSKGYKATTVRDIAEAMEIEAASLYHYMTSKHALLEHLLFEVADQFKEGLDCIIQSKLSPSQKLEEIVGLYVQITSQNPYKAALLTSEWRNLNPDARKRFLQHRHMYEKNLKTVLIEHFNQSKSEDINPEIALHTFLGAMRWIYDWYIEHKGEINPIELRRQLFQLINNGFSNFKK